jgi:3-hydroxyisobutyrate dehydrogenase
MNKKIGICGIGKMGLPLLLHLSESLTEVRYFSRSTKKDLPLNAVPCNSPKELIENSDVVLCLLFDDTSVRDVYEDTQNGFLATDLRNKMLIEMTTVLPATATDIATKVQKAGGIFIESPVSGTTSPARNGQLMALVGASTDQLDIARPILELFTRKIVHAGPVGNGAKLKLTLNLPLAIYWQSIKEALMVAKDHNLDLGMVIETMADSGAGARVLQHKMTKLIEDSSEVSFDVSTMIKDVSLIQELAGSNHIKLEALSASLKSYQSLLAKNEDADASEIVKP